MISTLTQLLFGDDTRHWPDAKPIPLVLDLAARSLNRVKIGDPADRIREFGRPANRRPRRDRRFRYPTLGLVIETDPDNRVDGFTLYAATVGHEPDVRPGTWTLVLHGRSVEVRSGTKLADVAARLGVVPAEDRDDVEIVAKVSVGPFDCDFECDLDGSIEVVNFYDGR